MKIMKDIQREVTEKELQIMFKKMLRYFQICTKVEKLV